LLHGSVVIVQKDYPEIVFKLGRRKTPKSSRLWLTHKKDHFSKKWEVHGRSILKNIERNCGLGFPKRAIKEGIEVYLYKSKREDGNYLGDMIETEPLRLNIYLKKRSTWRTAKSTLIHELIHCIMWQAYYFDYRRRNPTLFEDYFADELITCIVEQIVLGRKLNRKMCREAFEYALGETKLRLARMEHSQELTKLLVEFAGNYKNKIRSGESSILTERKRLLQELPSPLPETL